jgi:hypothetical protein
MAKKNVTLREFLHIMNTTDNDIDMSVDGTDTYMAVCFGDIKFTPEGEKMFGDCLDKLHVDGRCIVGEESDYDQYDDYLEGESEDGGLLRTAEILLHALAGYCSCSNYDKWFEGDDAKLI